MLRAIEGEGIGEDGGTSPGCIYRVFGWRCREDSHDLYGPGPSFLISTNVELHGGTIELMRRALSTIWRTMKGEEDKARWVKGKPREGRWDLKHFHGHDHPPRVRVEE